jgi:hypothetical protein
MANLHTLMETPEPEALKAAFSYVPVPVRPARTVLAEP